jgi:transposase
MSVLKLARRDTDFIARFQALGHDCVVVAPALIPRRSGERIKTNRRDAVTLARLHRAGELTGVWAPDAAHEAVRDLVRARDAADDLRRKRQQLLSFLLRHSRIYSGGGHWTLAHRRWLAGQKFEHAAQQIVFQERSRRSGISAGSKISKRSCAESCAHRKNSRALSEVRNWLRRAWS